MAHFLVTGGAGFIGSHLVDTLIATHHTVTIVDDLSTGKRENVHPDATLVVGDCMDSALIQPLVDAADGVYHLAAIASVPKSCEQWLKTSQTNQMATVALLEAISKRAKPISFVYASSAAVYGDPVTAGLPISEMTTPTVPLTPYGADKLGSEHHASVARHLFGIPTLGLRFFNVYGPRQDPKSPYSGVISIFISRISAGLPVSVFGDGEQTRDFVYVMDVVAHLMAAMHVLNADMVPEPVALNVCTSRATSVNQLAETIAKICDKPLDIKHEPARSGDIRHSLGNAFLAANYLNISAGMLLDKGLKLTIDSIKNH